MKRHEDRHRKINPAAPGKMPDRNRERQDQRDDPDRHRNAPTRDFRASQELFAGVQTQRFAQFPGTQIKKENFRADSNEADRVDRENGAGLSFHPSAQGMSETGAGDKVEHRSENRSEEHTSELQS